MWRDQAVPCGRLMDPENARNPAPSGLRGRIESLRSTETAKAAGLAVAQIITNVIALGSTVVFARLLDDYGSLAALVSYFLILSVAGQAMQVATAREGVLGHLGSGPAFAVTLRSWTRRLLVATVVLAVISILLRHQIASLVGVKEDWAAATGLPAGCLWLLASILRGALQALGDYKSVGISLPGEQTVRLVAGAVLAGIGLDVTGAYLGTPISMIAVCLYCGWRLRDHLAGTPAAGARPALGLGEHFQRAWAPIAGLVIIAVLQNIDIIVAKHQMTSKVASSYSATAVAAKVLVWVAIGAGFYLVPEVSRRYAAREETRGVLARALMIIGVAAVPCLLIFFAVPRLLLRLAFGSDRLLAVDALPILGIAFTVLAATYLAIQYMLAQRRTLFLIPMAVVAVAEPILLLQASGRPRQFALVVLAIQCAAAIVAFGMALRRPPLPPEGSLSADEAADAVVEGPATAAGATR